MIKLKDLITEKSDRKEYERAYLKKIPLNRLRNSRAAVANRPTGRWYGMDAHEYLTMHDDELKRRGETSHGHELKEGRLDEYPASGPYKTLKAAYTAAENYIFDFQTVLHEWMVSEENKGNISKSDKRPAKAYQDMLRTMMDVHRKLKVWNSVMEGIEKVKHQGRDKHLGVSKGPNYKGGK